MIQSCVFTDELSPDLEDAIRICAELRVPYVEIRGVWGTDINRIDPEGAERVKAVLDSYGIRVGIIGSGFGKCSLFDEDEWQEHLNILDRQMRFCDLFGTRLIRMFPFWVPREVNWRAGERPNLDEYLGRIVDRLRGPCQRAEREGIVLSMETEDATFSGTCPETRAIIDAVGSSALTVCWDVVNSWTAGRIAYPDDYEYLRGLVTHVHVKDAALDLSDRRRKTGRTYIGRGDVPWADIFRTLRDDGYDGLASVETHLFFDLADRFHWLTPATEQALRNLNRILAEVQGRL